MGFLSSGLFWGVIVVLIGVSIILNVVLGVKIPLFRVVFGLLLIYWGVSLLAGSRFGARAGNSTIFSDTQVKPVAPAKEYNILFGKGEIDLTGVQLQPGRNRVEINTVFGASVLRLNPDVPVSLEVSAAFSGARLPDGNTISFGDQSWLSPGFKADTAWLEVKASVVFGGMEVRLR
jgi:predicted membrane protein